jgi:tetratricopeptide (TPR) repeat protein
VDEQIACDRKAIALDPDYLTPYFNLSSGLESQGQRDEAIAVLRQAAVRSSDDPQDLNNLAWVLATSQFSELHDAPRAVALAQKAVALAPELRDYWNTLGAAQYRAGSWKAAVAALEKSMALGGGGSSVDWFFLAMACWQLGEPDKARVWCERAVQSMEKNAPDDDELLRFRAEATELLQLKNEAQSETKKGPHQSTRMVLNNLDGTAGSLRATIAAARSGDAVASCASTSSHRLTSSTITPRPGMTMCFGIFTICP